MYPFASARHVSRTDREHIERWIWKNRGLFTDKTVLDYGCGKQPYRKIVEQAGGTYYGFDNPTFPDSQVDLGFEAAGIDHHYDVVLCTQVLTLIPKPERFLSHLRLLGDMLVLTVSLGYRQFHPEDRYRWTESGLTHILTGVGFVNVAVMPTWKQKIAPDYEIVMGLSAVAS